FRLQFRLALFVSESKTIRAFCGRLKPYWSVSPGTSIEPVMVCAGLTSADRSTRGSSASNRIALGAIGLAAGALRGEGCGRLSDLQREAFRKSSLSAEAKGLNRGSRLLFPGRVCADCIVPPLSLIFFCQTGKKFCGFSETLSTGLSYRNRCVFGILLFFLSCREAHRIFVAK